MKNTEKKVAQSTPEKTEVVKTDAPKKLNIRPLTKVELTHQTRPFPLQN